MFVIHQTLIESLMFEINMKILNITFFNSEYFIFFSDASEAMKFPLNMRTAIGAEIKVSVQ